MAFDLTALPPPDVIETLDYDAILTEILTWFRSMSPLYTNTVQGDPAYTVLQAMAYRDVMTRKRINDAARAVLVTHAIGADLDNLATFYGLRREGRSDAMLRAEMLNYLETIVPGSPAWYRKYALKANSGVPLSGDKIVDAKVFKTVTPGEVRIFVQPDAPGALALETTLPTAVQGYLNQEPHLFLGDTVKVETIDREVIPPNSINPISLEASIKVAPGFDEVQVLRDIQLRANAFVKNQKTIGQTIQLSHIYAALITSQIEYLQLTQPSQNVVARPGGISELAVKTHVVKPPNKAIPWTPGEMEWSIEGTTLHFSNLSDSDFDKLKLQKMGYSLRVRQGNAIWIYRFAGSITGNKTLSQIQFNAKSNMVELTGGSADLEVFVPPELPVFQLSLAVRIFKGSFSGLTDAIPNWTLNAAGDAMVFRNLAAADLKKINALSEECGISVAATATPNTPIKRFKVDGDFDVATGQLPIKGNNATVLIDGTSYNLVLMDVALVELV